MSYEGFLPGMMPAFIDTHAPDTFVASECSNAVFIHNPYGTRRAETPEAITKMRKAGSAYGLELVVAETLPDVQGNMEMLQGTIDERSLVVIRAGDGGLNKVLSAVRALGLENPIKTEAGGHMNDTVNQIFSKRSLRDPAYALAHSVIRSLRPIELTITEADGTERKVDAYGYFSAGVTDAVADTAASDSWREAQKDKGPFARYVADSSMAAQSLLHAKPYTLTMAGEDPRRVIDIIATNGSKMAGDMKFHQQLLDPGYRLTLIRNRATGTIALGAAIANLPVGKKISPDTAVEFEISGRENDQIQVDGDKLKLNGPTKFRAQTATTGVNMVTDRSKV